jgi:hypothetical protein
MAETPKKSIPWGGLELAIEGEGLSPSDVSVRQLAELLQAAASAADAIAEEQGIEPVDLRLVNVRKGSAAYDLTSPSPDAGQVLRELYHAAKTRAKKSTPKVRHAMQRLHGASKLGSLRMVPQDSGGKPMRSAKAIHLAPPIEEASHSIDAGAEIQGRVVGVFVGRGNSTTVRIRHDRGGTDDFSAEPDVAETAARLFNRRANARVTYSIDHDTKTAGTIERVSLWEDEDLLEVVNAARQDIESDGDVIDVEKWLEELDAAEIAQ